MADSVFKPLAEQTRELYWEFRHAGFTDEQALELVKTQFSFAMVNQQMEKQRRYSSRPHYRSYYTETPRSDGDATCQE